MYLVILFFLSIHSQVDKLDEDAFKGYIKENKHVLVKFYTPWCGHCKALAPEYIKAAEKATELGVKLAEVDCTEETELCQEYKIKGYPSVKFFTEGKPSDYEGERNEENILMFLKKRTGKTLALVNSKEDLDQLTKESFIVAYLPDAESEDFQQFKTASMTGNVPFAYVTESSLLSHLTSESANVFFYRNGDKKTMPYGGEMKSEIILKFINDNYLPPVVWLTKENSQHVFTSGSKVAVFAVNSSSSPVPGIMELLNEVSDSVVGKVQITIIDAAEPEFSGIVEFFGFADIPSFAGILIGETIKKYHTENNTLEKTNVGDFLNKFLNNELERSIKKQAVPEDWDTFPVKVVTLVNFNDVIFDDSKDSFVMFYAEWCGHCKKLMPIWEQLALHFEENGNIVIAKTDATKNEYEFDIQGFPTLVFFPSGQNKGFDSHTVFSGDRKLDELVSFVNSMSSQTKETPVSEEL